MQQLQYPSTTRKPSTCHLSPSSRLWSSSDEVPSEHGSVYDAILANARSARQDSSGVSGSEKENISRSIRRESGLVESAAGLHVPQRLCSITEQKSLATLKTIPSNTTFQKRIMSLQPSASGAFDPSMRNEKAGIQRRVCFSLDESMLRRLRASEAAHRASMLSSADEQHFEQHVPQAPGPLKPPYEPPIRSTTPDGLQKAMRDQVADEADNEVVIRRGRLTIGGRLLILVRRGYTRAGRRLALAQEEGTQQQAEEQLDHWRPPVSGHTTSRFAALDRHPFASAAIATVRPFPASATDAEPPASGERVQRLEAVQSERTVSSPDSHANSPRAPTQSPAQEALTASQRALTAISGHAIPVSLQRLEAIHGRTSACLPRSRTQSRSSTDISPVIAPSSSRFDTVRTSELISNFPEPPRGENVLPVSPAASPEPIIQRGRSNAITIHDRDKQPVASSPPRRCTSSDHTTPISEQPIPDLTSLRGESYARYRLSGIPVYALDAASLLSRDQHADDEERSGRSSRSGHTGMTRYYSASSQARAQPVISLPPVSQEDRAVANGALRYLPATETSNHIDSHDAITPVTVTSYGKLCPHMLSELHNRPTMFEARMMDGVSDGMADAMPPKDRPSGRGRFQCWRCRNRVRCLTIARHLRPSCLSKQ